MRDVAEVLKEKEADIDRVTREVEALRRVAPLLSEEAEAATKRPPRSVQDDKTMSGFGVKH